MLDETDVRTIWLEEAKKEARQQNPLIGYCRRICFVRTTCKRRCGPKKGQVRKRKTHEVEMLQFLPSGRCVTVKDTRTPGLDSLAEEIFSQKKIPPHITPVQLFLDYFRKL